MGVGNGRERLNDRELKARIKEGNFRKLADGAGLALVRLPSGCYVWQSRYRLPGTGDKAGKLVEKTFSHGVYPEVSLAAAREAHRAARVGVKAGHDPVAQRRTERAERAAATSATFEKIAREWLAKEEPTWSEVHLRRSQRALERDVFPKLGNLPIGAIKPVMVAGMVKTMQKRGVRETASKVLQHVGSIFRYAQAHGYRDDNPADAAHEVLIKAEDVRRRPALLNFPSLGDILRRAETANVSPSVRMAHRLIAFTGVRVANAIAARWQHFDLDGKVATWTIPRDELKVRKGRPFPLKVILPPSIAEDLRRWRRLQPADAVYCFPGFQGRQHVTEEAIEKLLSRALDLQGKHCPHGWRSALSTLALDNDFDREVVALALDHVHANEVARAYDRGERLHQRVKLAEWWGEQLAAAEERA